jgi:hypothetical protein
MPLRFAAGETTGGFLVFGTSKLKQLALGLQALRQQTWAVPYVG